MLTAEYRLFSLQDSQGGPSRDRNIISSGQTVSFSYSDVYWHTRWDCIWPSLWLSAGFHGIHRWTWWQSFRASTTKEKWQWESKLCFLIFWSVSCGADLHCSDAVFCCLNNWQPGSSASSRPVSRFKMQQGGRWVCLFDTRMNSNLINYMVIGKNCIGNNYLWETLCHIKMVFVSATGEGDSCRYTNVWQGLRA